MTIDQLRELCSRGRLKWTTHMIMRLQQRKIEPSDIRQCIMTGEIIEQYPQDYPYPSCLVLGTLVGGQPLHVVVGGGEGYLFLVTAYVPRPEEWEDGFRTRKEMDK